MADDLIDCADQAEFAELHAIACKVLPGDYPRTVGQKAWKVPPDENGEGGVPEWYGGGRHVAVEVTGHVAPVVDEETGQVRMPATAALVAAMATEQAAVPGSQKLTPGERGKMIAALASAKPAPVKVEALPR